MRKTISVNGMLDWANKQLARTDEYADMKFKAGVCSMIEEVLYRSGGYKGFKHLPFGSEYNNEYCRYYY